MPENLIHNVTCAAQHIADWAILPSWFSEAFSAVKAGIWKPAESASPTGREYAAARVTADENGVAVIELEGPLMKLQSKYGGSSTLAARSMIRHAVKDSSVRVIMLHIDSPGGTVAGTHDLAQEVSAANKTKPVYAHIDDLGASAAYWVASQAQRITANATAMVGSIGTYAVVHDMSGMAEMEGIKVHVISTGEFKGMGIPGTVVTDKQLAYMQERIDGLNEHFLKGVTTGRGMPRSQLNDIADGRVFIALKAMGLGLIDAVSSFDQAYATAVKDAARQARLGNQRSTVRNQAIVSAKDKI
jgi:signal peptide peptidase SppA